MTRSKEAKAKPEQESARLKQMPIEARIELLATLLAECIADEAGSNAA